MMALLLTSVYLCLPMVFGGILHMAGIKTNFMAFLSRPINQKLFGSNKTYRGFVLMPLATWLGCILTVKTEIIWGEMLTFRISDYNHHLLGFALGFAYVLFELPNSFFKRRLGVAPGQVPKQNAWFFILLDHVDSLTGCFVIYVLFFNLFSSENAFRLPLEFIGFLIVGPVVHLVINFILYLLRIRKQPL